MHPLNNFRVANTITFDHISIYHTQFCCRRQKSILILTRIRIPFPIDHISRACKRKCLGLNGHTPAGEEVPVPVPGEARVMCVLNKRLRCFQPTTPEGQVTTVGREVDSSSSRITDIPLIPVLPEMLYSSYAEIIQDNM